MTGAVGRRTERRVATPGQRRLYWTLGLLAAATVVYAFDVLPGEWGELLYMVTAVASIVVAAVGMRLHRPRRRTGWMLVLLGFATWVLGDLIWSVEYIVLGSEHYPGYSDVPYLAAYGLLAAGGMVMIRSRAGRDLTALLDAAIAAAGTGVVLAVFVFIPLATDGAESVLSRVVYTFYPLGDLLLLVVMIRLWTSPGATTWSFRFLMAAYTATFAADMAYSLPFSGWYETSSPLLGSGWLAGYILMAAAASHPSMLTLAEAPPMRESQGRQRRSLVILTVASTLPAVVLLVTGARGHDIPWQVIGIGSLVLSALVLTRMSGLVQQVQEQSVQLAALARRDSLTGAPNRRSWDHELSRACARAREEDTRVCIAVIDLDHFKRYNDTFGHPAGDRLLREAVAAWIDVLGTSGILARYGGEEFTVLTEDVGLAGCVRLIERLQSVTPDGQTFSAGVACWDPATDPSSAVAQADEALYEAKRRGRNRVVAFGAQSASPSPTPNSLPSPRPRPIDEPSRR